MTACGPEFSIFSVHRAFPVLQEFPALSREYYEAAFAAGRLRLEGGGRARRVLSTTPLMVPAS